MSESLTEKKTKNSTLYKTKGLFEVVLKKWWVFLSVGILSGVGGIIYATFQKPVYKSKLTFALNDNGGGSMSGLVGIASQFGLNIGEGNEIFSGDNILEIMKSRKMVESVFLSTDTFSGKPYTLIQYYLNSGGLEPRQTKKNQVSFPIGQAKSTFTYLQDSVLYANYKIFAEKYLSAQRPDRKLDIFEVNVSSASEKFSKVFTDRLVSETGRFYIQIRSQKAKQTFEILEGQMMQMKGGLNASISDKAVSQDANLNPALAVTQVPIQKQQTNIQVYGTAYAELFKNLELARFQYLNEIPLMQIIDAADYPMERIKTSRLKSGLLFATISCLLLLLFFWIRKELSVKENRD
jgi:hypothetical protein